MIKPKNRARDIDYKTLTNTTEILVFIPDDEHEFA